MRLILEFITILAKNLLRGVIPGSLVVVYKKDGCRIKFLIIKTLPSGSTAFPSGSISWGENYEKAARRELYEETGIKAKILKELPLIHKFRYYRLPLRPRCEQHIYLYEMKKLDKTKLHSKETEWFRWVSKDEALKMITHKELRDSFRSSFRYIN